MQVTRIFVVRHGQSTSNRDNLISGHTNPALTEQGIEEAKATQALLSHIHFDDVYSSDLIRAAHTAEIIYGQPVPKDHQLPGFRERSFGPVDGKDHSIYDQFHTNPTFLALSHEERWKHHHMEGVESDEEVAVRFEKTLRQIAEQHTGKTILIGAHAGAIRTLLVHLGYATITELPPGTVGNAAFVELLYQGGVFSFGQTHGITPLRPKTTRA